MKSSALIAAIILLCGACSASEKGAEAAKSSEIAAVSERPAFSTDSAYAFVKKMVDFGPRVPNTQAHREAGDWMAAKLREYGWEVTEQNAALMAFDGTRLDARNIFAQLNPEKDRRLLLLTHWDSRPWADQDPDPSKRHLPVPAANDGASGVGILLEMARQLSLSRSDAAVDILMVDAEDWGDYGIEDSWALGTQYFVKNPPVAGYRPQEAILLDMVGAPGANFGFEYFSYQSNPKLLEKVWSTAYRLGFTNNFHMGFGGAVTDDHDILIKASIPSIDIIDYRGHSDYQGGFEPMWHTTGDNMDNISPETLGAVGTTLLQVIAERENPPKELSFNGGLE